MKRILSVVAILLVSIVAVGQTTTSKPAVPTTECADVQAILTKVPKELWPQPSELSPAKPETISQMRERAKLTSERVSKLNKWTETNAKDKRISFPALAIIDESGAFKTVFVLKTTPTVTVSIFGRSDGQTSGAIGATGLGITQSKDGKYNLTVIVH